MFTSNYTHKVQYYETDQMGIVHHSNYIRWFEEARIVFLEEIGFPYQRLEQEGILSPVISVDCSYKSMVHFGDTVLHTARVESFNGIKLKLYYQVLDAQTQKLMACGSSSHCFLNEKGQPVSLKRSRPDLYSVICSCMEEAAD